VFLSLFTLLLLYSHFTTQQTSTKCACSVSVRLLFLGSFKEDFVTVPQSVNVCYLHADNAGADITDPEPMQQELNRQPDAASITDVHWHLCMNVVLPCTFFTPTDRPWASPMSVSQTSACINFANRNLNSSVLANIQLLHPVHLGVELSVSVF